MSRRPYLPADGGFQRFHRLDHVRPALVGQPNQLFEGTTWSVYSGSPDTHYASGAIPGASVGAYMPSSSFFAASLENGNVKAIRDFRLPSTAGLIGVSGANIRALIPAIGPRVYIGDSVYRALDCTIRLKLISESFDPTVLTWNNAPTADASPVFTLTLNGTTGNHIGLVQTLTYLYIDGEQLDQSKTYYGMELTVDTSFTDNGVPTQFIEPHGWWGTFYGLMKGPP